MALALSESELAAYQAKHPCIDQYANGERLKCCRWKWTQAQNGARASSPQIGLTRTDTLPRTVCGYDMGTACSEGQEASLARREQKEGSQGESPLISSREEAGR